GRCEAADRSAAPAQAPPLPRPVRHDVPFEGRQSPGERCDGPRRRVYAERQSAARAKGEGGDETGLTAALFRHLSHHDRRGSFGGRALFLSAPEFLEMVDHSTMRLGRKPRRHDPRAPRLARYLAGIPAAPDIVDYTGRLTSLGMMANDRLGDCTCAAIGHAIQTWTSQARSEITLGDGDVITLYERFGYDP